MRELLRSNDLVHLSWARRRSRPRGSRVSCSMPTSAASRATSERFRAASWSRSTSWSAPGKCSPGPSKRSRVAEHLTDDHLLGGRVRFSQPAHGYRVAIDPVLLAAAVPARAGERVLDAGAGTGAASLCLAARVPECRIVGLELQRPLQRIASHNVTQNGSRPGSRWSKADWSGRRPGSPRPASTR